MATSLRSIPSLPQVHQSLLAELEDNRTAGSVIARMVAEDPGFPSRCCNWPIPRSSAKAT
jgi:HD-like signal output (HDOD) protein